MIRLEPCNCLLGATCLTIDRDFLLALLEFECVSKCVSWTRDLDELLNVYQSKSGVILSGNLKDVGGFGYFYAPKLENTELSCVALNTTGLQSSQIHPTVPLEQWFESDAELTLATVNLKGFLDTYFNVIENVVRLYTNVSELCKNTKIQYELTATWPGNSSSETMSSSSCSSNAGSVGFSGGQWRSVVNDGRFKQIDQPTQPQPCDGELVQLKAKFRHASNLRNLRQQIINAMNSLLSTENTSCIELFNTTALPINIKSQVEVQVVTWIFMGVCCCFCCWVVVAINLKKRRKKTRRATTETKPRRR